LFKLGKRYIQLKGPQYWFTFYLDNLNMNRTCSNITFVKHADFPGDMQVFEGEDIKVEALISCKECL